MVISSTRIKGNFVSKVVFVDYNASVLSAINLINTNGAVIVNKSKKSIGILDSRSLERDIQRLVIPKDMIVGKIARSVPFLNEKSSIFDAIRYMHSSQSKSLPYMYKGKIIGIVKRPTILAAILSLRLMKGVKANDIMTINLISIENGATISNAISLMKKHNINRLIVTDSSKNIGMISNHDIVFNAIPNIGRPHKFKTKKAKPSNIPVNEFRINNPLVIDYISGVDEVIRSMIKNSTSSIIITRNKKWIGIITISDIFEYLTLNNEPNINIHISGFDETTEEYRTSIQTYADNFINKTSKFNRVNVESLSLRFKRIKDNKYNVYARASVKGVGIIYMRMNGFYLERTVEKTLSKLKGIIIKNMKKSL